MDYLDEIRFMFSYEFFFVEIVIDFYDKLKLRIKGYVFFEYELSEYKILNLVKVDILVLGKFVDVFLFIVYNDNVFYRGKVIC